MKTTPYYDTLIIGGSYAGLSAAMALGRSLRKVLIIDSGQPCNKQTPHSHNFLTQDGVKPSQIAEIAKEQVLAYPTVEFQNDLVIQAKANEMGFEVRTQSNRTFYAKKILLAFGVKDELPPIPGFADCWGISVIHCPYCHGYEFHGKKTGIFAKGDRAFHLATLVANLTDRLKLIYPNPDFSSQQLEKLRTKGIDIIEKQPAEIIHREGYLDRVIFSDGTSETLDALYADVPFSLPGNLVQQLGCKLAETGRIVVDPYQQTSISGVFACGDCVNPIRSVAASVASGNLTGAMINHILAAEQF